MSTSSRPEATSWREELSWRGQTAAMPDNGVGPDCVRVERRAAAIASDLERVAAELDLLYRSCQMDDAIPLYDALHSIHRAILGVHEAGDVVVDHSYPEQWIA